MMSKKTRKSCFTPAKLSLSVAAAVAALAAMPASAFSIDTGNPEVEMRWDNQVRYNAGWRMENVDQAYYRLSANDESAGHFKKNDMVMNRLDLLTEFEFVYKENYGLRVSAAAWYESAYGNKSRTNPAIAGSPPSNFGADGNYSRYAKRFITGSSGEFLDAFVFGNFMLGDTSVKVKAGSHNVFWGEALYSVGDGVSAGQGPVDTIKASSSPGTEAKELFMPLNQVSTQVQLSDELSVIAQYLLDWKPYRLTVNGTYFNGSDGGGNGLGNDPYWASAGGARNAAAITPGRDGGDYGVGVRWSPSWLQGTMGFYYRKYDEKTPWSSTQFTGTGAQVRLAYARDTELFGLSLSKVVAGVSVGSELVYRKNTALNSYSGFWEGTNGVRAVIAGTPTYAQAEGARGDTYHFLLNGIWLLPKTMFWDSGALQGEFVYQRLDKVTKNENVFYSVDYLCKTGYALMGVAPNARNKGDGCVTKYSTSLQVGFTPQWPQLFPSWDLSLPMSYKYGLYGNSPAIGGSYEGAYNYSIGTKFTYRNRYDFTLQWNDAHVDYKKNAAGVATTANASGSGGGVVNNKGWLNFSFKTSF